MPDGADPLGPQVEDPLTGSFYMPFELDRLFRILFWNLLSNRSTSSFLRFVILQVRKS
jgi:hypothetical protein